MPETYNPHLARPVAHKLAKAARTFDCHHVYGEKSLHSQYMNWSFLEHATNFSHAAICAGLNGDYCISRNNPGCRSTTKANTLLFPYGWCDEPRCSFDQDNVYTEWSVKRLFHVTEFDRWHRCTRINKIDSTTNIKEYNCAEPFLRKLSHYNPLSLLNHTESEATNPLTSIFGISLYIYSLLFWNATSEKQTEQYHLLLIIFYPVYLINIDRNNI